MALTDKLVAIGDAIREKNCTTEKILLTDMPQAIRYMKSDNVFEYATQLNSLYNGASFPEDYELRLFLPCLTSIVSTFQNATGLKKLIIKGNSTGAPINFTYAFRCESLEVLDLSEFNAIVGVSTYMFNGASSLLEIKGELDFSPCTAMNNTFAKCYALEALEIKENSLSISASFAQSSKLSAQSVQSIIDGLVTIETAQTLTLNSAITLTDEQKSQINSKGWTLVQ